MKLEWMNLFQNLSLVGDLEFPRFVKPNGTLGNPILSVFSDVRKYAYGKSAHIRWRMENGNFKTCLLGTKIPIAPS
jgi:hypothetical protein